MEAHGKCRLPRRIQILPESKDRMKPTVSRWVGERKKVFINIAGEAALVATESGGWILFTDNNVAADISLEGWYRRGTVTQKNTLRALEALLFYSNHGLYPPNSEMLYGYHQNIIDLTGIMRVDPHSGHNVRVSTSSPLCTTTDMNRFITVAFQLLLDADVPSTWIEPLTAKSPRQLYHIWYAGLAKDENFLDGVKTWDDYRELFPYDEFHLIGRNEAGTGETQKIHIVSRGADAASIDEPWNWIHGATSVHQKIHNSNIGWEGVLQEFPHMLPKVRRAREIAKKKELI